MRRLFKNISISKGFTLIEVMVVVVIVGTLMAAGVPNLRHFLAIQQIKEVARRVLNGAQEARSLAIERNGNVSIVFNNSSWCIYDRQLAADVTCDLSTAALGTGVLKKSITPNTPGIAIAVNPVGANQITFNGFGRPVANADGSDLVIYYEVSSLSGTTRKFRADFTDGALRICESTLNIVGDPRTCS